MTPAARGQARDDKGAGSQRRPVHYATVPFSTEIEVATVQELKDGTTIKTEDLQVTAQDSQGRHLFSDTNAASGMSEYTVEDPQAGTRTVWNTKNNHARVLEYATPVEGRKSCWKLAPEDMKYVRGEPQLGVTATGCAPAGQQQPAYCRQDSVAAEPQTDARQIPVDFAECVRNLSSSAIQGEPADKTEEDLGIENIQGYETHGCRVTARTAAGTFAGEQWLVKFRTGPATVISALRGNYEYPVNGNPRLSIGAKRSLVSLTVGEPDLAMFTAPRDYEIKTVAMHEVACEEPKAAPVEAPVE
jgi:hypothetical protein